MYECQMNSIFFVKYTYTDHKLYALSQEGVHWCRKDPIIQKPVKIRSTSPIMRTQLKASNETKKISQN